MLPGNGRAPAAAPQPHAVDRKLAPGLAALVDGMLVQQHLDLGEHAPPAQAVLAGGHRAGNVAARGLRQLACREARHAWRPHVPAGRVRRVERETVAGEMAVQQGDQLGGVVRARIHHAGIEQRQPVAMGEQVHRVGAQPVAVGGLAPVEGESERRDRPVLLALDLERLAQPGFQAERRKAPGAGAREEQRGRRQLQFPVRDLAVVARPEQIGYEQCDVHDGNFFECSTTAARFGASGTLWHTGSFPRPSRSPVVSYETFIGLRYTRARQRTRFISVISAFSIIGIALGMTALITVLSVMNGFQREIRTRILGVASHVQLSGPQGTLTGWSTVAAQASRHEEVVAVAPFVAAQGLLTNGAAVRGAFIRGVLPAEEDRVAEFGRHMRSGSLNGLKSGEYNVVLGAELARALGVAQGDKVVLVAPQGQVTPAGIVPRLRQFTVVGIFGVDHYEYDSGLALVHLEDAQRLFRLDDAVSGVRLKLKDLFLAPGVARELTRTLGPEIYASDWTQHHANFFRAVQIEKRMMFLIVFIIIFVAAFNIISSLLMAVKDKQSDIAILRTLGAAPGSITKIFLIQGTLIGIAGTLLGLVGGISLALNVETVVPFIENVLGIKFLAKDVYYITDLPSEVQTPDVVITAVVAFLLTLLATLYPSWRAAKTDPVEALRYE